MSIVPTDERAGLPSASSIEACFLCPGRWLAQQGLSESEKSEDAERGTRIHEALENGSFSMLSDDESETAERCLAIRTTVTNRWVEGFESIQLEIMYEERIWLHDENLNPLISGKADFIIIQQKRALIIDYKTGRNEAEESAKNEQLRTLAVLVAENYDVEEVTVGIIQPWVTSKPELCVYQKEDLAKSKARLLRLLDEIKKSDAPRVAGESQCKYCKAKAFCPETHNEVRVMETVAQAPIQSMTGEQIAFFLNKRNLIEKTFDAIEDEGLRRLNQDPDSIPGWCLKPGVVRESIIDVQGVFSRLHGKGISADRFAGACSLTKTNLKSLIKEVSGAKGKQLDAEVDAAMEGFTESKQSSPSLARVKGDA